MGNTKHSRRNFFRSLANTAVNDAHTPQDPNDPLFKKYSRKKGGRRRYSTQLVEVKVGTEEGEDALQRVGNPVTSGVAPYTGPWTEWEVLHLLRRTNFGWKKVWVDQLLPLSPAAAVDAVLNVTNTSPAPPVVWYANINADANGLAQGADWTEQFFTVWNETNQTTNFQRLDSLRRWLFGLTLNGDVTIREKMVWFWYHLIPVDFTVVQDAPGVNPNSARILYRYLKLFRDEALTTNYKNLIKKVSLEPSMMYYLNNQANSRTAPDENFAREVMELFTLGKDPQRYTEDDVRAAARALTGWRVKNLNTANVTVEMDLTMPSGNNGKHDNAAKNFSAFFGANATIPASNNPATWAGELDQFLDLVFGPAQAEYVSKYICRRLYRFFVYYDIDTNVENNVIVPLAETFRNNNWNIKPVLAQLFKSQHFFDMANRGVFIKPPFDVVAGMLNGFNVNTASSNIEWQYRIWSVYNDWFSSNMGQRMGTIPNVSGWLAFYQPPAYHQYWINATAAQDRFRWVDSVIPGWHTVGSVYPEGATSGSLRRFSADTVAFAAQFGNTIAADPNALVATCIKYLLPLDLTQAKKDELKGSTLLSGQTTDAYWTNAWNVYIANPSAANRNVVESRLKNLLTSICRLAEYQLM